MKSRDRLSHKRKSFCVSLCDFEKGKNHLTKTAEPTKNHKYKFKKHVNALSEFEDYDGVTQTQNSSEGGVIKWRVIRYRNNVYFFSQSICE